MDTETVDINTSMSGLKKAIFAQVRLADGSMGLQSDDDLNKLIFHHPAGLRLSYSGFIILKKIFTVYSFEIPDTIKTKHRLGMSQMEYPYFFTKKPLYIFPLKVFRFFLVPKTSPLKFPSIYSLQHL